jgi:hypothetical protein
MSFDFNPYAETAGAFILFGLLWIIPVTLFVFRKRLPRRTPFQRGLTGFLTSVQWVLAVVASLATGLWLWGG